MRGPHLVRPVSRPTVAAHGLEVLSLSKMLKRHANRRNSSGPRPPRKPKEGKRAAAVAAAARASEAAGLCDMSAPSDASALTVATASLLLKGRQTEVSATEYDDGEAGEEEDEGDICDQLEENARCAA